MENIVALNSGGFDSIVMLHKLWRENRGKTLHTLFVDYGQKTACSECLCADNFVDNHSNTTLKVLKTDLPFSVKMSQDNEYIPMRNLVLLSLAVSYAESIGAKEVYIALIDNRLPDGEVFYDCTQQFIDDFNKTIEGKGIKVIAPFIDKTKLYLYRYIYKYGIKREDVHSCNFAAAPGCGECPDCKKLEDMFYRAEHPSLTNIWMRNNDVGTSKEEFEKAYMESPITEVRVHNNHKCQLKCEHCYYGDYELHDPYLSYGEMWEHMFLPAIESGVRNFHFSGKEPLYGRDESLFNYAERLKKLRESNAEVSYITYDLITNGINLPQCADRLKELGFSRICLSVDDIAELGTESSRTVRKLKINGVSPKALESAVETGIPVEVFISLYNENTENLTFILTTLYDVYHVTRFFLKGVIPIGHGSGILMLNYKNMDSMYEQVQKFALEHPDCYLTLNLEHNYTARMLKYGVKCDLEKAMRTSFESEIQRVDSRSNLYLNMEYICHRYANQVTVTPDGYILGCASEVSTPCYWNNAAGNVLDVDNGEQFMDKVRNGRKKFLEQIGSYLYHNGDIMICDKCTFPTCI